MYGIWCIVFGGVTGHREAWLKQAGETFRTDSKPYAERMAADLADQVNRSSRGTTFRYEARPC